MEFIDVINNRRSIRHYNELEVKKDIIEEIIDAGIKAPSAHNRQPWRFIVISDEKLKNVISDTLLNETSMETKLTSDVIKTCSALILVFEEVSDELMDTLSVGAAIENMILRSTDLGVKTLWIGYIVEIAKIIEEMFSMEEKLVSAIALGYSEVFPKMRPRKEKNEVVKWIEG
ncbi:MAG: nitroreductase family protein [Ruminococcus sp.]|nr:nitroreductase family protein [Ruminococcus sp.]